MKSIKRCYSRCRNYICSKWHDCKKSVVEWGLRDSSIRNEICDDYEDKLARKENAKKDSTHEKGDMQHDQENNVESPLSNEASMVKKELLPKYFNELYQFCREFPNEKLLKEVGALIQQDSSMEESSSSITDKIVAKIDADLADDVADPLYNIVTLIRKYSPVGDAGMRFKSIVGVEVTSFFYFPAEDERFDNNKHAVLSNTPAGRYIKECIFPGYVYEGMIIPAIVTCK